MSASEIKFDGLGWDRDQVSLRMTLRRKTRLLSLARELPPEATPTDAVDRALDLAIAGLIARGRKDENTFDATAVSAALSQIDSEMAATSTLFDAKLTSMADDLSKLVDALPLIEEAADGARRLHRLADAVQADGEAGLEAEAGGAPPSLRDWLRRETERAGRSVANVAFVKAEWMAARKIARTLLSIDLSCQLVAVDGQRVDSSRSFASPARIDLVDASNALAGIGATGAVCLLCEPQDSGAWLIRVHSLAPGGKVGSMIASVHA